MDSTKWKSVVIPIDAYRDLKRMAEADHRTISGQFTYILRKINEAVEQRIQQETRE